MVSMVSKILSCLHTIILKLFTTLSYCLELTEIVYNVVSIVYNYPEIDHIFFLVYNSLIH